tara:strand:+ start:1710 stop:3209 length:1500 start_codon:yes stop_codon:yes gene_type:complete
MGKSKGSQSSELDPAIRDMMTETFGYGRDAISEEVQAVGPDGQPLFRIDSFTGMKIPVMTRKMKEYEEYTDPRFAEEDAYTTIGEREAVKFLGGNQFAETDRYNDLYGRMSNAANYTPDTVSATDVAAGKIDLPSLLKETNVSSRDVIGERVADPNDITAREVFERDFNIERVDTPDTITPQTFSGLLNLDPYLNPYNELVRDVTISEIEDARDRQLSDLQSRAIQANAFGGTREGVEAGLIQNQALQEIARQTANLGKQGFDTATQLATQDLGLLNQAERDNVSNLMEAQRLNQATDLAAEQSMLNAAMEAQRLNQARDLSLGQFNTEIAQQAALANQANQREIELANAARDLQAQGMNQDEAFRVAQSNVDNKYRAQAQNVENQLQADLANQSANLEASLANQSAGLAANELNQGGLLNAANLASGVTESALNRYGAMTDIGDRRMARNQQQLDFDYQQFLEGQEYQMMLAQFLGGLLSGFPTPMKSRGKESGFTLG